MKRIISTLMFLWVAEVALVAQETVPTTFGETETEWRGVKYIITKVARLDDSHVLIGLKVSANESVAYPTMLATPPPKGFATRTLTFEEAASGEYRPRPFTMASATLLDQKSGAVYQADPALPASPYFGPNEMITALGPKVWVQMAVQFNAPSPLPPKPDGKIEPQKVTLTFPKGKAPIKNVEIPREIFK